MRTFKRRYLLAGEIFVSEEPYLVTTVLGSCVSVCLWDASLNAGGMNHYAAPRWDGRGQPSDRFGDISIKDLIRRMLGLGCRKKDLKAKVFGGGRVLQLENELLNAGEENIKVAEETLCREGITIISSNVGGAFGRKLVFNTYSGNAYMKRINSALSQETRGGSGCSFPVP